MIRHTGLTVGIALIVAALALVVVALSRPNTHHIDTAAAARSAHDACTAFADVYEATRPGTPTDAPLLAAKLETAIADMRKAADTDPMWRAVSDALARSGTAVNQGDTAGAAAAFQDVHDGCVGARITTG